VLALRCPVPPPLPPPPPPPPARRSRFAATGTCLGVQGVRCRVIKGLGVKVKGLEFRV
jgi:hypothetical protein